MYNKVYSLKNMGNLNGATIAMKNAMALYPNTLPERYIDFSEMLQKKGNLNGAEHAIKKAFERSTKIQIINLKLFYKMSIILLEKGDLDGAETAIREAIKLEPNNISHKKLLAKILEQKKIKPHPNLNNEEEKQEIIIDGKEGYYIVGNKIVNNSGMYVGKITRGKITRD